MFGSLLNIFKIADLRRKIFITLGLILVYRIGAHVPCPFVNLGALGKFSSGGDFGGGLFGMLDMFSGGAFKRMTIFSLGIMPYITAGIILQLLTVVWPYLEKIAKEGEAGRKKINQYTRYGTIFLAAFQSMGVAIYMIQNNLNLVDRTFFIFATVVAMTTGTAFIMWLGEKITEHGIGNGISLIIAAGIMADYRNSWAIGYNDVKSGKMAAIWLVIIAVLYVVFTALIILTQKASRKVPIQYARRVVGRREMQGGSNFLPLMLNTAGVIPVIFASSILTFPSFFFKIFSRGAREGFVGGLEDFFNPQTQFYNLYAMIGTEAGGVMNLLKVVNAYYFIYILLTIFFCYFYTAITFNPVDMADNLKRVGAFIPGRRPGKNTSDYIDYVLSRITLVGSLFLVVVALVPSVLSAAFGITYAFDDIIGGTGLIIVAGVMLDLMNKIESQLLMRHYEGFKYRPRGGGMTHRPVRGVGMTGGGSRTLSGERSGRR